VGDTEVTDPDELHALALQRDVDYSTWKQEQEELQRLRQERSRPLTEEEELQIAQRQYQRFLEQKRLAEMPEEERRLYQREKALRDREEALKAEEDKRQQAERGQALQQAKEQLRSTAQAVMEKTGLPSTASNVRRVLEVMKANMKAGRNYPPEVVARQVREERHKEFAANVERMKPADLLRLPKVAEHLNGLEDVELLKQLGPLGERLRRLNLEALNMVPQGQPPAQQAQGGGGGGSMELPTHRPPTDAELLSYFRNGGKAETPEQRNAIFRFRAAGKL
jgi:hypothetical protein